MDIFKQLQGDVTELTEFCLESPRRPLSSSSYTRISSRPTSFSDLDHGAKFAAGEHSKASYESSRASVVSSQASTLTSSKEELPRLEPFDESIFQLKPINSRGIDSFQKKPTSRSVASSQTKSTSNRAVDSPPQVKPTNSSGTYSLSQVKPSTSSNGSDSLLGAEEVDTPLLSQPSRTEGRGGLKGSCSVGKLAGSPSITKLQEETGSVISRNSSIDSGIQFASDPETNGLGGLGPEPTRLGEFGPEPSKLGEFGTEPSKLGEFGPEPSRLWEFGQEPTALGGFSSPPSGLASEPSGTDTGLSLADDIFSTLGLLGTQS